MESPHDFFTSSPVAPDSDFQEDQHGSHLEHIVTTTFPEWIMELGYTYNNYHNYCDFLLDLFASTCMQTGSNVFTESDDILLVCW